MSKTKWPAPEFDIMFAQEHYALSNNKYKHQNIHCSFTSRSPYSKPKINVAEDALYVLEHLFMTFN